VVSSTGSTEETAEQVREAFAGIFDLQVTT
jgi:hypothetical protein